MEIFPQEASPRESRHLKVWRQRDKREGTGVNVVWKEAAATFFKLQRKETRQKSRWWGGRLAKTKKQTMASFLWRSGGWKSSDRSDEALQRSMKRASIIQQLWIMGQHAEAVAQITGSEREERRAAFIPVGDTVGAVWCSTSSDWERVRTRRFSQNYFFKHVSSLFTNIYNSSSLYVCMNAARSENTNIFKPVFSSSQLNYTVSCRWQTELMSRRRRWCSRMSKTKTQLTQYEQVLFVQPDVSIGSRAIIGSDIQHFCDCYYPTAEKIN